MKTNIRCVSALILSSLIYSGFANWSILHGNAVDKQNEYDASSYFTRPWSNRRGIESTDRNAVVTLVRVPLNLLSNALAAKAIETRWDVLGSKIKIPNSFVFAYQIVGQEWSIMIADGKKDSKHIPSAAKLSKQLGQPVITLAVSDTSGVIGYEMFENGATVEYFGGEAGESMNSFKRSFTAKRYVLSPYPDSKQTVFFWSRRRQVTAKEIGNMWKFAEVFMHNANAYDPGIDTTYLLGEYLWNSGKEYQVKNPGFSLVINLSPRQIVRSIPELVRVDYFRF
jgi:hypothetical protein